MTDLRQAAQAVIDRWDSPLWKNGSTADAIADLRTALEQQQAEPVCPDCKAAVLYECVGCSSNNYPPQRKPLTDEEIADIYMKHTDKPMLAQWDYTRAIEAAHKIKENT